MAMAPPPQGDMRAPAGGGVAATRGDLQIVRAETQNWLGRLDAVAEASKLTDKTARDAEVVSTFTFAWSVIAEDIGNVEEIIQRVHERLATDPDVAERIGDEVTHIINAWTRARFRWERLVASANDADALAGGLSSIRKDLESIILSCGYLTIPRRIQDHLANLRIGQGLDFRATFVDELPNDEDRLVVLKYLHSHPATVDGVVDVENGMIFKASPKRSRRYGSFLLILMALIADYAIMSAIAWGVPQIPVPGATADADRWEMLWKALTAALAGGVVHIFVGAVKQTRNRKAGEAFLALDDLVLWAHVREVQLVITILTFAAGLIGMILVVKKADPATAFFVGYSIDSVTDIFLEKFDKTASAQVATIQRSASS